MKKTNCLKLNIVVMIMASPFLSFGEVISLKKLELEMLSHSLELRSKEYEIAAATEKREALPSNYIPKLTLEGNYKYLSEIPEINMLPGRGQKLGDNSNYSIGPTLSMTIFDFNSKTQLQSSLDMNVSSKRNEAHDLKAKNLFKTRYHYLNLVYLIEKRNLISESLKVANKQLKDVEAKKRFGSGSKLDLLSAQKEVHELESQDKEISFNIIKEQTELFKVSFSNKVKDANLKSRATYFEKLAELQKRFYKYQTYKIEGQNNARVKSMHNQSNALESQAESIAIQRYPKINLFARTSLDYPNGPEFSQINQNVVGVSLSMPLFDGGEIRHNSKEKSFQAMALRQLARNEERSINESIELAIKRIQNLEEQNDIIKKKIHESNEIAKLLYKSYQEGRATFLEVERVNVKSRESRLSLSSNQYEIILNLIQLANVAGE